MSNKETVNIRPSVGYLSILQAINYRAGMLLQNLLIILFKATYKTNLS